MNRLAILALLAVIIPFLAQASSCDASSKWDQAIAAKGGRDKLESLRTFFWSGEMTVWQGLVRRKHLDQMLYVFPDFAWSYQENSDPGLGRSASHIHYDEGYSLNADHLRSDSYKYPLPNKQYMGSLPALLMETRWMKPKLGGCNLDDTAHATLVEAEFSGWQYDFHFARGESLPSKVVQHASGQIAKTEWTLSNYRQFGGIMLPTMFRQRDSIGILLNLDMRYEINPEVPSGLIDSDPTHTMAPEGWRKLKSRK
jgi:hypothetical protein